MQYDLLDSKLGCRIANVSLHPFLKIGIGNCLEISPDSSRIATVRSFVVVPGLPVLKLNKCSAGCVRRSSQHTHSLQCVHHRLFKLYVFCLLGI